MKNLKHLLQLIGMVLLAGLITAQEPADRFKGNLIFSEYSQTSGYNTYIEIANVGDTAILLDNIKLVYFGRSQRVTDVWDYSQWRNPASDKWFFLNLGVPEKYLQPGETIVISQGNDDTGRWPQGVYCYGQNQAYRQRPDFQSLVDILIHREEATWAGCGGVDSVTTYADLGNAGNTSNVPDLFRQIFYLEQHLANGDSVIIDQIDGIFDDPNGSTTSSAGNNGWPVAGVERATKTHVLVRKYNIKSGNLDFRNAVGVGAEDSEWMPIPSPQGIHHRDAQWTVGNHLNAVLDENTLEPKIDDIEVDFSNKQISVPWGIRRMDDIMRYMKKKPGIGWHYDLSLASEDSIYGSVRTGDKLTIYAAGNELQQATFDIVLKEPSADVNIVVPKNGIGDRYEINWPRVTQYPHYPYLPNEAHLEKPAGVDTITGGLFWQGISFAMRSDTLLKYLEKPANARWEFVWVDGIARPDLKNGDKLKVTAQNGDEKEYYILVSPISYQSNANLASITWIDIPENLKGTFGWVGDTIPSFDPISYDYQITVPADIDGFPALTAKTAEKNATVNVTRATSFSGTTEMRTVTFDVTADDGVTKKTYKVLLKKEMHPDNIQPFYAEPFFSEYNHRARDASFMEVVNPGNQPLDMSNYMVAMLRETSPAEVIRARSGPGDWLYRYIKYIPGYKFVDEATWAVSPGYMEQDVNVNPVVMGGDVFCYGAINGDSDYANLLNNRPWFVWVPPLQLDVQFSNYEGQRITVTNPWGEATHQYGNPVEQGSSSRESLFLFKILNDSVKLGLKPANDPNDFEVIDAFGMADGSAWKIGKLEGSATNYSTFRRKPEIWHGNPVLGASFGLEEGHTYEWNEFDRVDMRALGYNSSDQYLAGGNDIGTHYFIPPTHYRSTINAVVYKVSPGYGRDGQIEEILGITTGTSVSQFLSNIYKENEEQNLTVKSGANGSDLGMDVLLSMNDTLVVMSADSINITKYRLNVLEVGLSSNAVLTSDIYEIVIESDPKSASVDENAGVGYVSGFDYGTLLSTVVNNVTVPEGAIMNIIDDKDAYVPLKNLNADTVYVDIIVLSNIYLEVVAEDGVTSIVYQLKPNTSESEAYLLSNVYPVAQQDNLVKSVQRGTYVGILLSNLIPNEGSTMRIVDKMGFDKTEGSIAVDDKVVVTSANGLVQKVYHLSMLPTEDIPSTTYLAYVLSDVYSVDQVDYIIAGPSGSTLLTEFYSRIFPSMGATAVVVDANGNEKTGGDLDDGDMLKVTSVDGKIVVMYELALDLTSVDLTEVSQFEIYPNPTSGKLNIRGTEQGNRIQVFNASGAMVREMKVQSSLEVLSLDDQPAGMFLIVISNDSKMLGRYKVIKK